MKLRLPKAVTTRFGRQLLKVQKVSPQIMFGAGVVGIVGAGVLACRSTLKLSETLEQHEKKMLVAMGAKDLEENYTDQDYARDLAKIKVRMVLDIAKLYAPAIGVAAVSIGLLTGSHVVLNRRNASLTAAYAAVDQAYREYRERVRKELGDEQDRNFRYGTQTVSEVVEGDDGKKKTVKHVRASGEGMPSQYARIFSEGLDMWRPQAEINRIFLQAQQNYANDLLQIRGHLFLNEVYDMLGFEHSSAGAVVGWVLGAGGDDYVDFGIFDDRDNPKVRDFVNLSEASILLDFNVDGVMYDKI